MSNEPPNLIKLKETFFVEKFFPSIVACLATMTGTIIGLSDENEHFIAYNFDQLYSECLTPQKNPSDHPVI